MSHETVLALAALPQDLRNALAAEYAVVGADDAAAGEARIAVTTGMVGADAAAMAARPGLRLIASMGVGLDKIDLKAARARGIAVSHTPDELTEDVADFAIGLMYSAARRIADADRFVRAGRWMQGRMSPGISLHRKRAGVVGLGRIGAAIAGRAAGIGMQVGWTGPRPKPEAPWTYYPDVAALAEWADVLILATPGGAETRHMVDARALAALGPRGVLVNIARGSVVDEAALLAALEGGGIAAAGLDVFASEPALDPRFLALENAVLAPHYASLTHETRAAIIARMLRDIAAFRRGEAFYDAAA
ncbi:NAD(P)-dependent oxidoreductase [Pararoseomonas indoligenes]|uniref:2-hydroxyacid dehydrogenase n=1 Tax=Roseomonas indoligenes TaxID=2820811 RepID=A0A940MY43_9PROT|nr:NAD(P)-dependent oxidoreductase [Pararoseomonas indoligenes]MBP0492586.1 2-hydroxyacid dehydrogenase [Pararoseomonas indoligenes]